MAAVESGLSRIRFQVAASSLCDFGQIENPAQAGFHDRTNMITENGNG